MITKASRITIVGCGGLGSNAASYLIRFGFKHITIVDFDIVSKSNLDRQFYFFDQIGLLKVKALKENLIRISNLPNIIAIPEKIDEFNIDKQLSGADVILECVDNVDVKKLIVQYALQKDKVAISASGICETCIDFPIYVCKKSKKIYLVGDGITDIRNGNYPISTKVGAVAAYQVDVIISLLNKLY